MSMLTWNARIMPDGKTIITPGVDFGGTVTLLAQYKKVLLVRVPASTVWSGIGHPRSYVPENLRMWEITKKEKNGYFVVAELFHYAITRKKKGE